MTGVPCANCGVEIWSDEEAPGYRLCGCTGAKVFLDGGAAALRRRLIHISKEQARASFKPVGNRKAMAELVERVIGGLLSVLYAEDGWEDYESVKGLISAIEAAKAEFDVAHNCCDACQRPFDTSKP